MLAIYWNLFFPSNIVIELYLGHSCPTGNCFSQPLFLLPVVKWLSCQQHVNGKDIGNPSFTCWSENLWPTALTLCLLLSRMGIIRMTLEVMYIRWHSYWKPLWHTAMNSQGSLTLECSWMRNDFFGGFFVIKQPIPH